jgi:hypothetical protein
MSGTCIGVRWHRPLDGRSVQIVVVASAILIQSCATVGLPHEVVREDFLSRQTRPHRLSADVGVESKRGDGDATLTVQLEEEWQCFDRVREVVRVRTYRKSEATNLGLDVVGAVAGVLAGTLLLAAAPSLSSMEGDGTDGNTASPRTQAYTFGGVALAAGVSFGINAARVAMKTQPELIRSENVTRERNSERGRYHCGTDALLGGMPIALVNGGQVPLPVIIVGRKLKISLRPALDDVCRARPDMEEQAQVVLRGTDDSEIPLATVSLTNCKTAAQARTRVAEAASLVREGKGSTLLRAIDEADEADSLWRRLPDSDFAKADIKSALDRVQSDIAASASKLDDVGFASIISKDRTSKEEVMREATAALTLATKRQPPDRAWKSAMLSIAEHAEPGARGYLDVIAIVKRAGQDQCLINDWQCPTWLTAETVETATQRLSVEFARSSSVVARQAAAASRALGRSVTLKNGLAAEAAIVAATEWTEACDAEHQLQVPRIKAACADLLGATGNIRRALSTNADTLARLKKEAEEQERIARKKKAERDWREQFARCRKLNAALPQAQQLRASGRCDGECKDALSKMEKDAERMAQFQGDMTLDPPTMETVRKECLAAGCPNCP